LFKKNLIALTSILIIVGLYVIANFSVEERRICKLFAVASFLVFFLIYRGFSKSKIVLGVLLSFLVSDILGFYTETTFFAKIIYLVRILGYFLLVKSIFKKVKMEKVKPLVFIIISIVIFLDFYLLYVLVENIIRNVNDIFEYIIILVYGTIIVITLFMSANYNLRYNTKRSAYFYYGVLTFVLSDLSFLSAYFLKYTSLFYTDVIFYFLGLFCIINYSESPKESEDFLLKKES